MSTASTTHLSPAELAEILRAADPAVRLVPARIMRRVIERDRRMQGLVLQVPHRKTYRIRRDALLEIADPLELGLAPGEQLDETVILIARPRADKLAAAGVEDTLLKYWRLLFHIRIHETLEQSIAEGRLTAGEVRRRIDAIGQVEFDEIRAVLAHERMLLPPVDDVSTYVEFVAVYLELRMFAAPLVARYFPSLEQLDAVDQVLAEDVNARRLYLDTRLAGAPEPQIVSDDGELEETEIEWAVDEILSVELVPGKRRYARLLARSELVGAKGNVVKAAILRKRASRSAPPEIARRATDAARADLETLVTRLRAALGLADRRVTAWRRGLRALLVETARGIWTPEARILYDLQKVCLDFEREIYTIDLIEWVATLGKRPIRRPLSSQREVLMCRHLRHALRRLRLARISDNQRNRLQLLLTDAVEQAEHRLREVFRPVIHESLQKSGLWPRNLPEQVARDKLVEELLDRIVDRGFLQFGDLRDALSRSDLKLQDVAGPREVINGDALLRADYELFDALEGVYRGGEFYLRWLQRITAVGFGTRVGRALIKYVALPFGGAYVCLEFAQHVVHLIARLTGAAGTAAAAESGGGLVPTAEELAATTSEAAAVTLVNWWSVLLVGVMLFGLLHSTRFRGICWELTKGIGRGLRNVFFRWPRQLLQHPTVRKIRESRGYRLAVRFGIKPAIYAVLTEAMVFVLHLNLKVSLQNFALTFLFWNLLLNSRVGRSVEEAVSDGLMRLYHNFRIHIVAEFFQAIMYLSSQFLDAVERFLYTVDEWLRFRSGENKLTIGCKVVLGTVWFYVTYVVRFCVNLLIEPQINPIKHFPVVTVSHKLLLPTIPLAAANLENILGLAPAEAWTTATVVIFSIPGIFGFLVWELKENWRLFEANRPADLQPVPIGHHGETMARYLRWGFHSGTIPKYYRRLRRADRKAQYTGNWKASRKYRDKLQEVQKSIRYFCERQLLAMLTGSGSWGGLRASVGEVVVGTNSVSVELQLSELSGRSVWIALQEQSGWLMATVLDPGPLAALEPRQRQTFVASLAGFYKLSGVRLVREQIVAALDSQQVRYDVCDEGLAVWSDEDYQGRVVYDLSSDDPVLEPQGELARHYSPLQRDRLEFENHPISWEAWVQQWRNSDRAAPQPQRLIGEIPLLPHFAPQPSAASTGKAG